MNREKPFFVTSGAPTFGLDVGRASCTRCPAVFSLRPRVNASADGRRQAMSSRLTAADTDWRAQNNQLMEVARRSGVDDGVRLLWEMEAAGTVKTQNFNQMISCFTARRRFEDAFDLAMKASDRNMVNIVTYRRLMKHCAVTGNGQGAKRVWHAMNDNGIEGDMFVYAELMGALVRSNDLAAAQKVIASLLENGTKPHIVLYNTLLKGVAKKSDVGKAFEILNQIARNGVWADETTYNTVLNTCVRAKDASALGKAMAQMRKNGIKPGVPTFNTLLKLYARSKNFQKALEIFNEMQQTVEPSIVTYNTLIDGCAHRGDMELAVKFFDEMIDRGLSPDICTMTSLLKGFGRANEPLRAVELYEAMKEGSYDIEDRTRYAILNACLRSADRSNAKRLLREMLDKERFECRLRTFVWMLDSEVAADDDEAACETIELMHDNNVKIDEQSRGGVMREMKLRGGFSRAISKLAALSTE